MNNVEYRVNVNFLRVYHPYFIVDKDGDGEWVIIKDIVNGEFQDTIHCVTATSVIAFNCKDILDGTVTIVQDDTMSYDENDKEHFVNILNKKENKNE